MQPMYMHGSSCDIL